MNPRAARAGSVFLQFRIWTETRPRATAEAAGSQRLWGATYSRGVCIFKLLAYNKRLLLFNSQWFLSARFVLPRRFCNRAEFAVAPHAGRGNASWGLRHGDNRAKCGRLDRVRLSWQLASDRLVLPNAKSAFLHLKGSLTGWQLALVHYKISRVIPQMCISYPRCSLASAPLLAFKFVRWRQTMTFTSSQKNLACLLDRLWVTNY